MSVYDLKGLRVAGLYLIFTPSSNREFVAFACGVNAATKDQEMSMEQAENTCKQVFEAFKDDIQRGLIEAESKFGLTFYVSVVDSESNRLSVDHVILNATRDSNGETVVKTDPYGFFGDE